MHEFETLEDAVIAKLTPLLTAATVRTLDAYSGELNVEEIESITLRFPCIYVVAEGLEHETRNRYGDYRVSVLLIVGDRHVRGAKSAARGDSTTSGVYAILESVRGYLHNRSVSPSWTPFVLEREYPIIYAPESNLCLYGARYQTRTAK